jgi:hypothetical protein
VPKRRDVVRGLAAVVPVGAFAVQKHRVRAVPGHDICNFSCVTDDDCPAGYGCETDYGTCRPGWENGEGPNPCREGREGKKLIHLGCRQKNGRAHWVCCDSDTNGQQKTCKRLKALKGIPSPVTP